MSSYDQAAPEGEQAAVDSALKDVDELIAKLAGRKGVGNQAGEALTKLGRKPARLLQLATLLVRSFHPELVDLS